MNGPLDFDQLQQRMVSNRSAAARLAVEHPASFVAFDLLAIGGFDARPRPWREQIGSGHFGGGSVAITRVQPSVVVEVAVDPALQGGRHRHAVRLVRLRPDLTAADITD